MDLVTITETNWKSNEVFKFGKSEWVDFCFSNWETFCRSISFEKESLNDEDEGVEEGFLNNYLR